MLKSNEERALKRRRTRALKELEAAEERELALQQRFKAAQDTYNARLRV
jgi:hypothetical protein